MSNKRHTCDKCRHHTKIEAYENVGSCALMGDSNDMYKDGDYNFVNGRAYGWDYEGYSAGVYVTPKFGCINWTKKTNTETN